jgi:3-polyprenyl-4-hydroxybenzoate decarboxylase
MRAQRFSAPSRVKAFFTEWGRIFGVVYGQELEKAGLPGIKAVWAHEVGSSRMLLNIAIEQKYAGHATQVGHVASQCHVGAYAGNM